MQASDIAGLIISETGETESQLFCSSCSFSAS